MGTDTRERLAALLDQAEIVAGLKSPRRDIREPGRRQKEAAEGRLLRLVLRHLRGQRARLLDYLAHMPPLRPAKAAYPIPDAVWADDEFEAALVTLLMTATEEGASLAQLGITLDYSLINKDAAKWARTQAARLVKDMDATSQAALQEQIVTFVETEGYTIGQVEQALAPLFGEERATRVAITEITNTYAHGEILAGQRMKDDFPDVRVIKTWHSSNDERVCFICAPLDGKSVDIDSGWGVDGEDDPNGIVTPAAHVGCRCWISTRTDILGEH